VCRDCPICGSRYLVRLANHLADVHQLDAVERKKYLQEAKLQPKVKIVVYEDHDLASRSRRISTDKKEIIYTTPSLKIYHDPCAVSDDEISEKTPQQRRCSVRWVGLPV